MTKATGEDVLAGVVHFGDERETTAFVRSLLGRSDRPARVAVVVNDGSWFKDLRGDPNIEIIDEGRNLGYAGGVNRICGLAMAAPGIDYVWILNTDLDIASGALGRMKSVLRGRPECDAVGGILTSSDRVWFGGGAYSAMTGRARHMGFGQPVAELEVPGESMQCDWINGACLLLRISTFKTRGPWDERLFLYREELEWQVRDPKASVRVLQEVVADHRPGGSTGGTNSRLGRTFMARNSWIAVWRTPRRTCLSRLVCFLIDYIGIPLLRGRFREVGWAVRGVVNARTNGAKLVRST